MKFLVDVLKFAVQVIPLVNDLVKSNKERKQRKRAKQVQQEVESKQEVKQSN